MKNKTTSTAGYFEPEITHVFLPGCRACGTPHPLARKPQMPADKCPDCGEASPTPGLPISEKASLGGLSPQIVFANACLNIGKYLSKLSSRI